MNRTAKRILLSVVGGVLVLLGGALLVLPGPGLVLILAGVVVLTKEYSWAERFYGPIRDRAWAAARASVATRPRLAVSVIGALVPVALGVTWIAVPRLPLGGVGTGSSLILGGVIAMVLLVVSLRRRTTQDDH